MPTVPTTAPITPDLKFTLQLGIRSITASITPKIAPIGRMAFMMLSKLPIKRMCCLASKAVPAVSLKMIILFSKMTISINSGIPVVSI